jgi:hypothetical protein
LSIIPKKHVSTKKGEAAIYFRITVNGVCTALSLQKSVRLNLWDTNLGLVKDNTQYAKSINREINKDHGMSTTDFSKFMRRTIICQDKFISRLWLNSIRPSYEKTNE